MCYLSQDYIKMICLLWFCYLLPFALAVFCISSSCFNTTSGRNFFCNCECNRFFFGGSCKYECHEKNESACFHCHHFHEMGLHNVISSCKFCNQYEDRTGECKNCPDRCTSCFGNNFCISCVTGMFGRMCDKRCSNCKPFKDGYTECDIDSGTCINGCVDGYFGDRCDKSCGHCLPDDMGRITCDVTTGKCFDICLAGYYGETCDDQCNSYCFDGKTNTNRCETLSGTCNHGCVPGWFGDTCNKTCSNTCSNRDCAQNTGYCDDGCLPGWFGDTCNEACSGTCFNGECAQNTGYCDDGCLQGWYGDPCNKTCSDTCSSRDCDQNRGYCDDGCLPGWFGDTCNKTCSGTCFNGECAQNTGYCDDGCFPGWFGDTCNKTCSGTCFNGECAQSTGYCNDGCLQGWFRDTCNKTCSGTCFNGECAQSTGYCDDGCLPGWYGGTCSKTCSDKCSNRDCAQNTGYCDDGCLPGWFGDSCDKICSDTCKKSVCDQEKSDCLHGCVTGYEGVFCNRTKDTDSDSILVGSTISMAGITASLLLALGIWSLRRIVLRGKRYGDIQLSSGGNTQHIYDEIHELDDRTVRQNVTSNHLYREGGTCCISQKLRNTQESGSSTSTCDTRGISGNGIGTTIRGNALVTSTDCSLVGEGTINMSTLHSDVGLHSINERLDTTVSGSVLPFKADHKSSSNQSRKYYEISDINESTNIDTLNYEISIPNARNSKNVKLLRAESTKLSEKCNTTDGTAACSTTESGRTQIKNATNSNTYNQTVNTKVTHETNCSGLDFTIQLQKSQGKNKAIEKDRENIYYIHPIS